MIIIIDGYNLLKNVLPYAPKNMSKERDMIIRQLGLYQSCKRDSIEEIIIVFDGGPEKHALREVRKGIVVVFSETKINADTWIINFAERNKGKEALLVSLDNALRKECLHYGVDSLPVFEFYKIMQETILTSNVHITNTDTQKTDLQKYKKNQNESDFESIFEQKKNISDAGLDMLMEQASCSIPQEKFFVEKKKESRKSKCITLSKKEKRLIAKMKKI